MFNSLKTKLLAAFAAVATLTAVVGIFGLSVIHNVSQLAQYTTDNLTPSVEGVGRIRYYFARALWTTQKAAAAVRANDKTELSRARETRDAALAEIQKSIAAFEAMEFTDEEKGPWQEMKSRLEDWKHSNNEIWVALEASDLDKAWALTGQSTPKIEATIAGLHDMIEVERAQTRKAEVAARISFSGIAVDDAGPTGRANRPVVEE
jgi:hypothetical protein